MESTILAWRTMPGNDANIEKLPLQPGVMTLNQATRALPTGGYSTLRTFGGNKVLRLSDHFDRLEETAALAGKPLLLDREKAVALLRHALRESPFEQARVRIIVDLEAAVGALYVLLEALRIPSAEDYRQGVKAVTRAMQRDNPKAKLTVFIQTSTRVQKTVEPGMNEVLMTSRDGRVLEGLSSNFFGVRGGRIYTAEEGVLAGITRSLVLEAAQEKGLAVILESIPAAELDGLDEAFITSASRAVLPVVEIDGRPVGGGEPGPVSQLLLKAYLERVQRALEEI